MGTGWTELVVIVVVALIVLGPKECTLNRATAEYRRQFEQALRDAEKELELEKTRKSAEAAAKEPPAPAEPPPESDSQAYTSAPESTGTAPMPDAKRHPGSKEA